MKEVMRAWHRILVLPPGDPTHACFGAFLGGVTEGLQEGFSLQVLWGRPPAAELPSLIGTSYHGVICPPDPELLAQVQAVPVVVQASFQMVPGQTQVLGIEEGRIGHLAVAHLRSQGAEHLAVAAESESPRITAFLEAAGDARSLIGPGLRQPPAVTSWLCSLPRPCGIFAFNDVFAVRLIQIAHEVGLRVPEDLLILGADDDVTACHLGPVPCSSVRVPHRRLGIEAALRLRRGLEGKPLNSPVGLEPDGVTQRASTNRREQQDPVVAAALHFIRTHAHQPIHLDDVAHGVAISRTLLTQRFRQMLGRTVHDELRLSRVRLAQGHMREHPEWTLLKVALESGFTTMNTLARAFREVEGCMPSDWRRRGQQGAPGDGS